MSYGIRFSYLGKDFVSDPDGHFCKSFCPASHKISISGDFRHCCRVMIYLDCFMSKNHDLLWNKSLRNRLIIAAPVMEFISTTPKNFWLHTYWAHLAHILRTPCTHLAHILHTYWAPLANSFFYIYVMASSFFYIHVYGY